MEEKGNRELAFLDAILKQKNEIISTKKWNNLCSGCRKPKHTDQNLHYNSHYQTSCPESVVSSLFNSVMHHNKYIWHEQTCKYNVTLDTQ